MTPEEACQKLAQILKANPAIIECLEALGGEDSEADDMPQTAGPTLAGLQAKADAYMKGSK